MRIQSSANLFKPQQPYQPPTLHAWRAGKEQSVRIQSSGGLSEDAIQQMVRDAESHAEKDKKKKEMIEVGYDGEMDGERWLRTGVGSQGREGVDRKVRIQGVAWGV